MTLWGNMMPKLSQKVSVIYLEDIDDLYGEIRLRLGIIYSEVVAHKLEPQDISGDVEYLIELFENLKANINEYCKQNNKFGYANRLFYKFNRYLSQLKLIYDLSWKNDQSALDYVCGLYMVVDDKGAEELSDFIGGNSETPYSKFFYFNFDDPLDAFLELIKIANYAEKIFYSLIRNKKHGTVELLYKFDCNRRRCSPIVIPTDGVSGRQLITAEIGAVSEQIEKFNAYQLSTTSNIIKNTGWCNTAKTKVQRGRNFSGNPMIIYYNHRPVPGQVGNGKLTIGRYGSRPHNQIKGVLYVMEVFNKLTGYYEHQTPDPLIKKRERIIAELLISYKQGNSMVLSEENIFRQGLNLPSDKKKRSQLVDSFHRAAYLICYFETTRRHNQGFCINKGKLEKVPQLPFGVATICALILVKDGVLSLNNIFSSDALYGVFTGVKIMKPENIFKTIKKFNELFSLFICYYKIFLITKYDAFH